MTDGEGTGRETGRGRKGEERKGGKGKVRECSVGLPCVFLQISFYRPTPDRHKVLMEHRGFPSDHVSTHNIQSNESLVS